MTKKRKVGIEFHVENNDYFGTLATVLDLMRQDFEERGFVEVDGKILKRLTDDLVYLQKTYTIQNRNRGEIGL